MTYVITEACIDVRDASCTEVCPVDCILAEPSDRMLFINPDECIDCGACVDVCPVDAIYAEEDVPTAQVAYTPLNALHFIDPLAATAEVERLQPRVRSSSEETA